jgi:HEAT repeat protein
MSESRPTPDHALHWDLRDARRRGDVDALVAGLRDPVEGGFAARYLADIHATQASPEVAALLREANPEKRSAALRSLGRLGATQFLPAIERLARTDPIPFVRASAVGAFGELAPPEEVRPLLHRALADDSWEPRITAAYLLGLQGSEEDIPLLAAAKRRDARWMWWKGGVYRRAIRAIRNETRAG